MINTEKINTEIMSHELKTDDWEYSKSAKLLYKWFKKFNVKFFKEQLDTPVISFERTGYKRLGHFVRD